MPEENELAPGGSRPRLTPVDVQQQQFKRSFRGYDEQEVDDFLDRVTESLASLLGENERLKEQARRAPTSPLEGAEDAAMASRSVDEIKRRAEEEAEGIIRDAHARAEAIVLDAQARGGAIGRAGAPAPAPAVEAGHLSRFVVRERSFLQELAGLIQSHAEGVKAMVQEARAGGQAQPEQAEGLGERGREPFGPPGATAGRDIDAADDAAAATAGTAEAGDQLESVTTRDDTEPAEAPATAIGEAVSVAPHTAPEVIDIPEAPEDRSELEETWAGSPDRLEEPAPVRFGSARAEGEEEDDARRKGARDNDSSLGDLFWGED